MRLDLLLHRELGSLHYQKARQYELIGKSEKFQRNSNQGFFYEKSLFQEQLSRMEAQIHFKELA